MTDLYTEIDKDRAGFEGELLPVLSMGDIFLNDYPRLHEDDSNFPKAPIDLVWNQNSCLLQNKQTISRSALYDDYWYESGINETMVAHLRSIVELAFDYVELKEDDIVLDIASNDGTLLRQYVVLDPTTRVCTIGYDPAKNLAAKASQGVSYHYPICFDANHFFDNLRCELPHGLAKIVTACAVVYHTPEPVEFLRDVARVLSPNGGVFICEFSYLPTAMKQNAYDMIGHEHTTHLSLMSFEKMLRMVNLEIIHVELGDINSGTIICVIKHSPSFHHNLDDLAWLRGLREYEFALGMGSYETYVKWGERGEAVKKELRQLLEHYHHQGKTVYLLGASTKASILLQWIGVDNKFIQKAVERNPKKVGKKMVALGIPIIGEEQFRKEAPDAVLIGPWCFRQQLIEREKEYLLQGGEMIFPLPRLEVVKK